MNKLRSGELVLILMCTIFAVLFVVKDHKAKVFRHHWEDALVREYRLTKEIETMPVCFISNEGNSKVQRLSTVISHGKRIDLLVKRY